MLDVLPEPAVVHERGTVLLANAAFAALLECDAPEELVGRGALEFVHPDDRELVLARLDSMRRNRRTPEHRLVGRRGTVIPVEVTGVPFPYAGRVVALATVHDLRERKRIDAELAAADRMATLGRMASAIGHELNNPLTYLIGSLELLLRDRTDLTRSEAGGEQLATRVRDALDGAWRIRDIVRELKSAAITREAPIGPVDLKRVLDVAIATTAHEVQHRARLMRDDADVSPVLGSELWLIQVMMNLLVNAAQAIPDGDASSHEIHVIARQADADRVIVEVLDTGVGFADIDVERMFEPFYTTKAGTGTGLGLSIAHRLVSACGGTLAAEPRMPRGACFRLTLAACGPGCEPRAREWVPSPHLRTARVLFAEDEEMIRRVAPELLEPHEVVAVGSGREAIALLARGDHFDAIVCDLQMPDLGGVDVYEWIAKHRPELATRIAFMTGGAFTERSHRFLAETARPRLEKPLDLKRVHHVLGVLLA